MNHLLLIGAVLAAITGCEARVDVKSEPAKPAHASMSRPVAVSGASFVLQDVCYDGAIYVAAIRETSVALTPKYVFDTYKGLSVVARCTQ